MLPRYNGLNLLVATISFNVLIYVDVAVTIPTNDEVGFAINGAVLTSLFTHSYLVATQH